MIKNFEKKIVVIDGLARSGTTLLSTMINSQKNSLCYRGIFHEFLACNIGTWKKDYALHKLINIDDVISFKRNTNLLHKIIHRIYKNKFFMSYEDFVKASLQTMKKRKHTSNLIEWKNLLMNEEINSFSAIDDLYQTIALNENVDVLGFRWNQGLPYIHKFLRNENHFWISLLRNPMDRAISDKKTFMESYEDAMKYTDNYGKLLKQTQNIKNHIIIYYEDLLADPCSEMRKIYASMGVTLNEINLDLYHPSGEKYRVETSELKDKGMDHTIGEKFNGFDLTKINKYKDSLNTFYIKKFKNLIKNNSLFLRYLD